MVSPCISLGSRKIGPGYPCYLIAEAGVNHNGDPLLAARLVEAAADAGADAVKFQWFDPELLTSSLAPQAAYQRKNTGVKQKQIEMLRGLVLPEDSWLKLKEIAAARRIDFLCTPFDLPSADKLAKLGVPAFKIGSGELTNHPFLIQLAKFGLPLLLSTGMSTLEEVREALNSIRCESDTSMALLHCVSAYPAAAADCNLRAIREMEAAFHLPIGFSDHTLGTAVSIAAVALGACVIEKHLTVDRQLPGPDHRASLEPAAFRKLSKDIRLAEVSLGDGVKRPATSELDTARVARRSIFVIAEVAAGERLEEPHVAFLRPGTGLPPARWKQIRGRKATRNLQPGVLLQPDMLEP